MTFIDNEAKALGSQNRGDCYATPPILSDSCHGWNMTCLKMATRQTQVLELDVWIWERYRVMFTYETGCCKVIKTI